VLKLDDVNSLDEFRKVSASKKSLGTYGKYGGAA
jgi:hypothetical protein